MIAARRNYFSLLWPIEYVNWAMPNIFLLKGWLLKKVRRILALVLVLVLVATPMVSAAMSSDAEGSEIEPLEKEIAYSGYAGSSYEASWKLYKIKGDILNFYVNNKGTTSVIITINGENARTLAPGEAGHISAEVNDLLNLGKWYTVKCVPAVSVADINITYAVAQRDST